MNREEILILAVIAVVIWGFVSLGSYINPLTGKREWWK